MNLNFRKVAPKRTMSRRLAIIAATVLASLLLLWAILAFVVIPAMMGTALDALNARLAAATAELDGSLSVGGIEASMGSEIVLTDVELGSGQRKILTVPRVRLDFSIFDVIAGRRMPEYLLLEDMEVRLDTDPATWTYLRKVAARIAASAGDADATASPQLDGAPDGRTWPEEIRIRNASIDLTDHREGDSILSMTDVEVVATLDDGVQGDETPSWILDGTIRLAGIENVEGGDGADLEMAGTASLDGRVHLRVSASAPLIAPRSSRIPAVVSLGTFDMKMDPENRRMQVQIQNLQLDDIGQAVDRLSGGRFGIVGRLGMDSATLELDVDGLSGLLNVKAGDISRISITGAGFSSTLPEGRLISVRDGAVVIERLDDRADSVEVAAGATADSDARAAPVSRAAMWGVDVSCMADAGRKGWSPLRFAGRFSRSLEFIDGHLTTEGMMPVALLSMLHNRVMPWGSPSLALDVDMTHDGGNWKLAGHASGRDLTYFWPRICLVPVMGVAFDTDFELVVSISEKVVTASFPSIRIGGFEMSAAFEYEHLRAQPVVKASVDIPRQSCQAVFDAIPPAMIPRLSGTRVEGEMSFSGRLDVNSARSSSLILKPDLDGCQVLTFGDAVDIDMLMSKRYVHRVEEFDDEPEVIATGPGTRRFTPLEEIPVFVQQAALATEDMNFFKHKGFAPGLIKRAILLNMDKGWYVYGGSTITQQLVKNLFLSREKTLARKLEEAIIVWELERRIPKERTLELYLNCIEFGYHIYGIRDAAKVYFNKTPMELTLNEAAFIMATKPNPKSAFKVYERRSFGKWWVERIEGIVKRLWAEMDVISERDYVDSWPWMPTFWYGEDGIYVTPEIVGEPDVPARDALGLPVRDESALPVIRLLPGMDGDGVDNDDDQAGAADRFDGAAGVL